jgi:hypothetical protein
MGVVVVKVSPAAAAELQAGTAAEDAEVAGLLRVVREVGGQLRPQHPGVADPSMARWFVLDGLDDRRAAEAAASVLRDDPAVESAYVKPSDEPAA